MNNNIYNSIGSLIEGLSDKLDDIRQLVSEDNYLHVIHFTADLLRMTDAAIKDFTPVCLPITEEEVDWSTIDRGVTVEVRDDEDEGWRERRFYGIDPDPKAEFPFRVISNSKKGYTKFKFCRLLKVSNNN